MPRREAEEFKNGTLTTVSVGKDGFYAAEPDKLPFWMYRFARRL